MTHKMNKIGAKVSPVADSGKNFCAPLLTSCGKHFCLVYDSLGVQLTGNIEVCYECACSKSKALAVRNKSYMQATNLGEIIFVNSTGPFPEILIETVIGLVWLITAVNITGAYPLKQIHIHWNIRRNFCTK